MHEHHTTGCDWAWRRVQAHMMAQHRTSDTNIKTHRSPSSHGSASDPEEAGGGVRQRVVAESSQVLARHGIFLKQIVVGAWLHCCDLQRATTRWARRTR